MNFVEELTDDPSTTWNCKCSHSIRQIHLVKLTKAGESGKRGRPSAIDKSRLPLINS